MAGPGCLLCFVIGLVLGVNTGVALLNVIVSPDLRTAPGNAFWIICSAQIEQSIVGCQFKLWHVLQSSEGELLNNTNPQGVLTKLNPYRPGTSYTANFDNDFSKGRCRVNLQGLDGEHLLVGCKLTALAGQSAVKTVAIYQTETIQLKNVTIRQQFQVAPGENVDILVKSASKLTSCWSTLANGDTIQVLPGFNTYNQRDTWTRNVVNPANSRYKPFGDRRLIDGECGFTINNAQDSDNGVFLVWAEQRDGRNTLTAAVTIVLIVSNTASPIVTLNPTAYDVNDVLTATCSVRGRQPFIAWTLGGKPLDNSKWKESVGNEWSWPWQEAVVSQSVTWKVPNTDDGEEYELGCQVVDVRKNVVHSSVVTLRPKTTTSAPSLLEMMMWPEHVQTLPGNEMTILCRTQKSEAITDCQFTVWYVDEKIEKVVLKGTNDNPYHPGTNFTAIYLEDYASGRCDVTLRGARWSQMLVGCKLKTTSKITAGKSIAVFQTAGPKLVLQESSQLVVARPGDNVNILVKSRLALSKCSSSLPNGVKVEVMPGTWGTWGNTLTPAISRYKAFGGKLSDGECGFTINNVKQRDNGVFFVVAEDFNGERGAKAVTLTVQTLSTPVLSLNATEFVAGHNATATCSVRGVLQPRDVIFTWMLGGVALGEKQASVSAEWSWPWQETVFTGSFTWTLTSEHDGKVLSCQVKDSAKDSSLWVLSNTVYIRIKTQTLTGTFHANNPTEASSGGGVDGEVGEEVPTVYPNNAETVSVDTQRRHGTEGRDFGGTIQGLVIGVAVLALLIVIIAAVFAAFVKDSAGIEGEDLVIKYQSDGPGNSMAASAVPNHVTKRPAPEYLVLLEDPGCSNQESDYLTPRRIAEHPTSNPKNLKDAGYDDVNCVSVTPEPEYEEINQDFADSKKAVIVKPDHLTSKYLRKPPRTMEPAAYDDVNCTGPEPEPAYEEIIPSF